MITHDDNIISNEEEHFPETEVRSERNLAKIRFIFSLSNAFILLFLFSINKIDITLCGILITLLVCVCIYSGMFFFESQRKTLIYRYIVFFSSFIDVTIIIIFIWILYVAGLSPKSIHIYTFPLFFLLIVSRTLHNRSGLVLFTGAVSITMYYLFCLITYKQNIFDLKSLLYLLTPGITILFITSLVIELFSQNNRKSHFQTNDVQKGFNQLSNTLPLIFFTIDKNGKILWIDSSSNDYFGISSKNIGESTIYDFIDDSEVFKFNRLPLQGTFKVKNFTQEIKFVDCVIRARDGFKNTEFLDGYMIDVTDRERAIAQREKMEEQLFQFKKMESLSTLASGMAHDFNNILQTINDIVDRIHSETSERETKQGMELVSETLTDAKFLISELTALGRKKLLDYNPLNISMFLRSITTQFSDQIGELYEVGLNISNEDLWIYGDKNYLKRIFQNLFGNARDAMPGGGLIIIECSLLKNESGDRSIVIRFSDTGVGIPSGISEKIFDPFFTTKKKGKGTGLGLALVKRIITLHKGKINVEKSDSQGTTFRIEIPECEEESDDINTKTIYANRITTTVLLLDDDPKIRKILDFFLADLSYKTLEASTMNEGLEILKKHIDDCKILIMDWKLPDNDPHTVIANYRALKPDLIIIVVSGYPPAQKSMKEMKIFRWITKPYDKNRLDYEIQKALHLAKKSD